jgi:RNA polymerase sigma factor (sigma-70 family)
MVQQFHSETPDAFTQYRSDIHQFATSLPPEERERFLQHLQSSHEANHTEDGPLPKTKQALIERSLWLPIKVACKVCTETPSLWGRVSDLVQEGNVGLLKAAEKACSRDDMTLSYFFCYATTYIRMEIYQFLIRRRLISVHYKKLWRVRNSENEDAKQALWRLMNPVSAEQPNTFEKTLLDYLGTEDWYDEDTVEREAYQEEKRAQVGELLSQLPSREQQIIRFRYGLNEEDEHAYSQRETAQLIGMSLSRTKALEWQAIKRLRGEMTPTSREVANREREARLLALYQEWQQQGRSIGILRLSQAAKCSTREASAFLQAHEGEAYKKRAEKNQLKQQVRERLQAGFRQMQAQGIPITTLALSRFTHAGYYTAQHFLQEMGLIAVTDTQQEEATHVE